ncbi:unnamed protein product, partial [Rotaria socialis]
MAIPEPLNIYYIEDRSPIHNSRVVKRWFEEHREIIQIPFPPKSPDLNTIENLYGYIAQEWQPRDESNKADLIQHAYEVWEGIRRRPAT